MLPLQSIFRVVLAELMISALSPAALAAPYAAGDRVFPTTLVTDDPFVADDIYGTVSRARNGATEDDPAMRETDLEAAFRKRLTESLGIEIEEGYTILDQIGRKSAYGFDNLEVGLKYQFFQSDPHEFVLAAGVTREFGGTGASRIGADTAGSTTPTLYFGKGFGDLPSDVRFLRPFAVTGTFGYEIADLRHQTTTTIDPIDHHASLDVENTPDFLEFGGAIEYSLPYLQGNVKYIGLPNFIDRLIPVVEFSFETPATKSYGNATTGIIAPGVIYCGEDFEIGAEALIPATRQSGTNVGFIATFQLQFDTALPSILGKPLWGP